MASISCRPTDFEPPTCPRNMDSHITPKDLELYVLDGLSHDNRNRIEEHLLICDVCRDELEREETFFKSMESAILREDNLIREKDCLPIDGPKKRRLNAKNSRAN